MQNNLKKTIANVNLNRLKIKALGASSASSFDEINAFPNENNLSACLDSNTIEMLQFGLSEVYSLLVKSISQAMNSRSDVNLLAAEVIAREPVVLLTHLILDRMVRLQRLVRKYGVSAIEVPMPHQKLPANLLKIHIGASSSSEFNQRLLAELSLIWGIPTPHYDERMSEAKTIAKNMNVEVSSIFKRVARKFHRKISRAFGKVPTLGLGYASIYFLDKSLFGPGLLVYLQNSIQANSQTLKTSLRENILMYGLDTAHQKIDKYLHQLGFDDAHERNLAINVFKNIFIELYPASHLENATHNLEVCINELEHFRSKPLFFSETGDEHTTYMIAAARALSMNTIGLQHAVRYGFTESTAFVELEFRHWDTLITWGVDKLPIGSLKKKISIVKLPSPWLSERAKVWRKLKYSSRLKEFDVLLMTDRIHTFPPILNTYRASNCDSISQISGRFRELALGLIKNELSILHKPFDRMSSEAIADSISKIIHTSNGKYSLIDNIDKGLTEELLLSCAVVVWDDASTGLYECWAGQIPTLLYRPRACSKDIVGEEMFRSLNEVGLAYKDPNKLAKAVSEIISIGYDGWLDAKDNRREVLNEVMTKYAFTDDNWPYSWKKFIKSL